MKGKKVFAFTRTNFILLAIGIAIVLLGMILMSGSGSDEQTFNPDIFSARRIKVAPVVALFGYVFIVFAILYRGKSKDENTSAADADQLEQKEQTNIRTQN